MKKPMLVNGTGVEKKVTLRPHDVFQEVHERTARIIAKLGERFKPVRVLLGPNEWLLVTEYVRDNPYSFGVETRGQVYAKHPDTILGYPVGLKQSNGIDFEYHPECAWEFVQGRIQEIEL